MTYQLQTIATRASTRVFQTLSFGLAAILVSAASGASAFTPFVIRNASAAPHNSPLIQPNNAYVAGATEFVISEGGQKAGWGSADSDGSALGNLTNITIVRHDNPTRFIAGSGAATAPYLNIWITDGKGNYAVVANEPSDPAFQPLYVAGYNLTWADLANKVAKVYENSNLSWLPAAGSSGLPAQSGRQNPLSANLYTFADLAGYIVQAPAQVLLAAGWPGLGTGAPRDLGTNIARGVNWVFGDTLANYVSGAEGYIVSNPAVSSPAPTVEIFTVIPPQAGGALNNLVGVVGDAAPGFEDGSFAGAAAVPGAKSDLSFESLALFGRTVKVGEIKSISYWTKTGASHVVDVRDWYLALYTSPFAGDVSTATWYGSRFGAEPYFATNLTDPANTWNQWTLEAATNQLRFFESTQGAPGATFGSYTDPKWADFQDATSLGTTTLRRNQDIFRFSLQTGSLWANGFTGKLDGLRIELVNGSSATVNFEAEQPPVAFDAAVTPGAIAVTSTATSIVVTGTIDDTATGGAHIVSAEYRINAGVWQPMTATDLTFNGPTENVTATFTLASAGIVTPGVYTVTIRGTDAGAMISNEDSTLLAVYDPSAGFVTGGGWIVSAPGALKADVTVFGKANFGFVSKYKKGATMPEGSTEFVFQAGGLNFHSSTYDWLIVNQNGTNAQFRGVGQINGAGNYGFMIWATDNVKTLAPDTFRIQIWNREDNDTIIYDNGVEQSIGGGNILVQTSKK